MVHVAAWGGLKSAILGALIVCIFALDTITNLEIAVAVLYVAVVLLSARLLPSAIVFVALASVVGTLGSFALTKSGAFESGLINAGLSLLAIAATTYLCLEARRATEAERAVRVRLAEASRSASLGELASMIGHEINQPLAAIAATASAAARWLDAEPPNLPQVRESIEAIEADTERAAAIVSRIRGLSAGRPFVPELVDLNALASETARLAATDLQRAQVDLRLELGEDLPEITGDRVQLQQVLLNLLANAREAILRRSPPNREIVLRTKRLDADTLLLSVRDTGGGIALADPSKVFEPFYSTKPNGTGLGLAISRSLVEAHGGRIWVERAESGAAFNVQLPLDPPLPARRLTQ